MPLTLCSRINIGNARIQGLESDLDMNEQGHDFDIALFVFFIPYILLEIPSNLVLKNIRPSIWLPSTILGWGNVPCERFQVAELMQCQGLSPSVKGVLSLLLDWSSAASCSGSLKQDFCLVGICLLICPQADPVQAPST
jgi:hypothetical protein